MTIVYVLAHFDDEYCALPLIRRDLAEGREPLFVHVVDYRIPRMAERRRRETAAFLAGLGIAAQAQIHLGKGLPWILYRASWPLAENGPAHGVRMSAGEWAGWLAAVGAFPSQFKAWSGLLPAMAMT